MATFTDPLFNLVFLLVSVTAVLAYLATHIKLEEVPKGRFLEKGITYGLTLGMVLVLLFVANSIVNNEGWNLNIFDWFQIFTNTMFWAIFAIFASFAIYLVEKTAFYQEYKKNKRQKKESDGEVDE